MFIFTHFFKTKTLKMDIMDFKKSCNFMKSRCILESHINKSIYISTPKILLKLELSESRCILLKLTWEFSYR